MQDQWEEYKKFTDYITGDGKRRDAIEAALRGDDAGAADPKKGKGKKGKKKKWGVRLSEVSFNMNLHNSLGWFWVVKPFFRLFVWKFEYFKSI